MSELEIRIALAGMMGIKGPWELDNAYSGLPEKYRNPQGQRLPELTLDWLHEVEKTTSSEQRNNYQGELCKLAYGTNGQLGWITMDLILATKHQRSEALLRTLNLWREEPL